MKDYEILLMCIAAALLVILIISMLSSKPIRPLQILQVDNEAKLLAREQIRKEQEEEREAEEKKKLKEEQERDKRIELLLEEANKRKLAEAALLEGKDVCMNCYTVEPRRCYCGHCACCGYCYLCDD